MRCPARSVHVPPHQRPRPLDHPRCVDALCRAPSARGPSGRGAARWPRRPSGSPIRWSPISRARLPWRP